MVQQLNVEKALNCENSILIDTRTPKEYEYSHIPKAINMPILSNDERHIIGLLYKKNGSKAAIEKGKEIFLPKVEEYLAKFKQFKTKNIIVYCARGGMRSKVITELLQKENYNVYQIQDGYKAYRNFILDKLKTYTINPKFIVIHGLTGTKKTSIIEKIDLPKIDLEGLAQHRSSLFGAVGLNPRTQKMFENLLFHELEKLQNKKFVIIEGESRKVGSVIIPNQVFKAMNNGLHIKINCSLDIRAKHIAEEYFNNKDKIEQIKKIVPKLNQALGNNIVEELLEQINNKQYHEATKTMLLKYYDPKYNHSLDLIKYDFEINSDDINLAIEQLKKFVNNQ